MSRQHPILLAFRILRLVVRVIASASFLTMLTGCATPTLTTAGRVAADARGFALAPKYPGQARDDTVSLVAEPELKVATEKPIASFALKPFYRLDPVDDRRTHADLRQASAKLTFDPVEASAGVGTFTWGVLESYRPTDVVNQLDFVEGPNANAKLGQPFGELGLVGEHATLRVYGLPYFRDRTFPGVRGRLRFPSVIDVDAPQFDTKFRRLHPSGAARATFEVGSADIGIGAFTGLSREPRFVVELTNGQIAPRYEPMHQGSADVQWVVGPFVLKGEAFGRAHQAEKTLVFFGGGGGADLRLPNIVGECELTIALEFLFDSRTHDAPPTFFDHDAFGGLRFSFEDEASTEISAGALVDVLDGTTFAHLDASRRFGEHWKLALGANAFFASSKKLEGGFAKDHYGQASLAYHF